MGLHLFGAAAAAIVCLFIPLGPAIALDLDPADAVKSALGGMVVDKIFDKVNDTITNGINRAQGAGNGLIMHASDQASILEQDAFLLLGDQRQKTFDQLNASEQNLLIEMEQWRRAVDKAAGAIYDIADTVNLDTSYQLQSLPFTHVPEFFVQSVHGVAFLRRPAEDYKITINALNLGIQADRKSEITVLLDNKPLAISSVDQSTLDRAVITLPNAALAPFFQQDHLRTVPLVIRIVMSQTGLIQQIFHGSRTYEVPITLTLYPDLAATIELEVHHPHYDWIGIGQVPGNLSAPTVDKNGKCNGNPACCDNGTVELRVHSSQSTPPVQGDQRIDSYELDCVTNPGYPFCRITGSNLIENGSHAIMTFQTWSGPVQMRVLATAVSEYRRRAADDSVTLPMNIYFDHTTQIAVPGDFDLLVAHVKTYTGKTYDFSPDTQPDPKGLVVKNAITSPGSPTRLVVLTANEPTI